MSEGAFEPVLGPSGEPFPGEDEWLDLPLPPAGELAIDAGFVDRTLAAIARARDDADADAAADPVLTGERLAAFAPPEPSTGFVDATAALLREDRTRRWRELLARHIAPEPAPGFVARTLAALAADREGDRRGTLRSRWRRIAPPLLAAAAAVLLGVAFGRFGPTSASRAPIEVRFATAEPVAFAHAHAATPLAAVLDARLRALEPFALPAGGPDATWLLFEDGETR